MERERLAIFGTENPGDSARIELVLDADGLPDLLGSGKYARVIRAVIAGRFPRPVAFKLEWDRNGLTAHEGAVKFVSEYKAQVRVHQDLKGDRSRVVRVFEMSPLPPGRECDELPPTLICPHSLQVLPPRCPCGLEDLPGDFVCPACRTRRAEEEVRAASACARCLSEGAVCRAYWLNRRACKLLLVELLDLSLEEYVAWRWSPPPSPPDRPAWRKFEKEHLAAGADRERRLGLSSDRVTREFDELRFLLDLFTDALNGVRELHEKAIAHLDLKPANLCLTLEGASARLKVIDLGQAHGPSTPLDVWYQSVFDDASSATPGSQFLAPEQMPARFVPIDVHWRLSGELHHLVIPPDATLSVPVLGGDMYRFPSDRNHPFLRVIGAKQTEDGHAILATSVDAAPGQDVRGPAAGGEWLSGGCLVLQAGCSADLFALGMLLAYLVPRGRVDVRPIREGLGELEKFLRARLAKEPPLPARSAVRVLSEMPDRALMEPWQRFLASLPEDRQLREISHELLGIALRAVVRGIPGFSYTQDRSADASCLEELRADLQAIRNRLVIHFQSHDLHSGRVARLRRAGLGRLRQWLAKQRLTGAEGEPPPYDREAICFAVDMLANIEDRDEREFRLLLKHYRAAPRQLAKDLDLFEKELGAHLVGARHIHPVVLALFEVVSPPRPRKGKSFQVTWWKRRQDQVRQLIDELTRFLGRFGGGKAQADLVDKDLAAVRSAVEGLDALVKEDAPEGIPRVIEALDRRQDQCFRELDQKIAGWDRLDFSGLEEWQRFGARCRSMLDAEIEQTRKWLEKSRRGEQLIRAVTHAARGALLDRWEGLKKSQRWTLRGIGRRILALFLRREPATRVELTPEQMQGLKGPLAGVEGWLRATRAVPFAGRLAARKASAAPRISAKRPNPTSVHHDQNIPPRHPTGR